ncbi:MAG: exonuclease subunit SbcD, partial [Deltaproteobacteria bacterium]|nr:exonuclease subunit SbcD [Deltaproteobacteria bacterium]
MEDHAAVLDEIVHIADEESVDLVVVSGDLFDRPAPPVEALSLVVDTLRRLAKDNRPVVGIAGNHDSAELFELLGRLMKSWNIHLVGEIKRPAEGGVLDLMAGGTRALVACFPFLREGKVVDFMQEVDQWYGAYAERVARLCQAYNASLEQQKDANTVTLLTAHFLVSGARLGGEGAPRGGRLLHIGESYAATEQAIPPGPQYVAMGHIHAPQA